MDQQRDSRGRKPDDFVRKYFRFDATTRKSTCLIDKCTAVLQGQHCSNLKKHIFTHHGQESSELAMELVRRKRDELSKGTGETSRKRRKVDVPKTKITIPMDRATVIEALLDLATVDGRPFSAAEDASVQKILQPIVEALNAKLETGEEPLVVNRKRIPKLVTDAAEKERENLRAELKGRMFSIKLDGATRLGRSILGINAQYCENGKLVLRNLACTEVFTNHTSENLKMEIKSVLAKYRVSTRQIYSGTTDNASNVVKTVKLLSEDAASADVSEESEEEFEVEAEMIEAEEEAGLTPSHLTAELPTVDFDDGVLSQRCAAHTLQLAIGDAMKDFDSRALENGRALATKLRTPLAAAYLRSQKLIKPAAESDTRFDGLLAVIDGLLELQSKVPEVIAKAKLKTANLQPDEWEELKTLSLDLLPVKIATKTFQEEQLTVGDFFQAWMKCKLQLKKRRTPFAEKLVNAMETREETLFDSQSIVSALYLDPRFQMVLSKKHRERAVEHLFTTWKKLESLFPEGRSDSLLSSTGESGDSLRSGSSSSVVEESSEERAEDSEEDLLEEYLKKFSRQEAPSLDKTTLVRRELEDFGSQPRLPKDTNILLFWETKKHSNPELYKIAQVALSVPVTQVSVERTFSHLHFIMSTLRSSLRPNLVEDILLVRCNRMFRSVKVK